MALTENEKKRRKNGEGTNIGEDSFRYASLRISSIKSLHDIHDYLEILFEELSRTNEFIEYIKKDNSSKRFAQIIGIDFKDLIDRVQNNPLAQKVGDNWLGYDYLVDPHQTRKKLNQCKTVIEKSYEELSSRGIEPLYQFCITAVRGCLTNLVEMIEPYQKKVKKNTIHSTSFVKTLNEAISFLTTILHVEEEETDTNVGDVKLIFSKIPLETRERFVLANLNPSTILLAKKDNKIKIFKHLLSDEDTIGNISPQDLVASISQLSDNRKELFLKQIVSTLLPHEKHLLLNYIGEHDDSNTRTY